MKPGEQGVARLKALTRITVLLSQCQMREELYKRRYEYDPSRQDATQSSVEHTLYKDYLRDLYVTILTFSATCDVYLSDNMVLRTTRSFFVWGGWVQLSADIQDREEALLKIEKRFEAYGVQEGWEKQQDYNKRQQAEDQAVGEEILRIADMLKVERRT